MDDLRREFEAYRRSAPMHLEPATVVERVGAERAYDTRIGPPVERGIEIDAYSSEHDAGPEANSGGDAGVVVYRAGMTIDDMEREAIRAALAEVGGNRRKAAELLGIGERTLYRKIAKYDLET
jgi:DNA-binding NtrC family response regulator